MSKQPSNQAKRNLLRRGLAGILSLALILGLLPSSVLSVSAASWADPYVETLVDWGVMRGDIGGNMAPDRSITRAEFVAMMNRAYGYTKLGGHPFTDVRVRDWYNEDVDIGYNIGYFKGTSPTTASPNDTLTREQAAVLLARNMMLQETVGETLGFSDSRSLSDWSRGLVGAAAANGIISGYDDGTFQPFRNITRGEVAAMLVRAIGTPIQTEGEHALGNVYGNVTVNTSGVKLRDGVIVGNLYLTGGIDLGDVLLENITVLGEIIVSGGGESNSSAASIVMRNVTADNMIVDSIADQFVTIRAEGITDIPTTTVRTNAYVDDSALPGYGLSYIELDGDEGTLLQLAGNVKEVWNKTPGSDLQVVQGSAEKITVDEDATGSSVLVDGDARVDDLNLDTATTVTGTGDIGNLNVGAAGSTVEQLPDKIEIRPGITADVNGGTMNSTQASESSSDPKLLAGYPAVKSIAPTSATLVFKTNKSGTIYWAISAVADGSVKEEDLLEPPVYGGNILQSGTVNATSANTEFTAAVTGLTRDGSYYVTAMLVDGRDQHSPIKVTSFTTPDDTVPAFNQGYPYMSRITTENSQVTIMTNKSCLLYYALLPAGSTAPTPAEFKANAITGNLGYGTIDAVKNVTQPFQVNSTRLKELTNYTLYLWLTDYDGAKSSAVVSLNFTTPDEQPPVIVEATPAPVDDKSAQLTFSLNEAGTLYWAVVPEGRTPESLFEGINEGDWKPANVADNIAEPNDRRLQVKTENGAGNAILKGSQAVKAGYTNAVAQVRNLDTATYGSSFTMYIVAKDAAGNYSKVQKLTIRVKDTTPPTVTLQFDPENESNPKQPSLTATAQLVFSEKVRGSSQDDDFETLYNEVTKYENDPINKARAMNAWAAAVSKYIKLYYGPVGNNNGSAADDRRPVEPVATECRYDESSRTFVYGARGTGSQVEDNGWLVNYCEAKLTTDRDNHMIIEFPAYDEDTGKGALKLTSGTQHHFTVTDVVDLSEEANMLKPNPTRTGLDFTISPAQVTLAVYGERPAIMHTAQYKGQEIFSASSADSTPQFDANKTWPVQIYNPNGSASNNTAGTSQYWYKNGNTTSGTGTEENNLPQRIDRSFTVIPDFNMDSVDDELCYDILVWSNKTMDISLYSRRINENGVPVDENGTPYANRDDAPWEWEGVMGFRTGGLDGQTTIYSSLNNLRSMQDSSYQPGYLKELARDGDYGPREFAIHVERLSQMGDLLSEKGVWDDTIEVKASVVVGGDVTLDRMSSGGNQARYDSFVPGQGVSAIGDPDPLVRDMEIDFDDESAPTITRTSVNAGATDAEIGFTMKTRGKVNYLLIRLWDVNYKGLDEPKNDVKTHSGPTDAQQVSSIIPYIVDNTDGNYTTEIEVSMRGTDGTAINNPDIGNVKNGGDTRNGIKYLVTSDGKGTPMVQPSVDRVCEGYYESTSGDYENVIKGTTREVMGGRTTYIEGLSGRLAPNSIYLVAVVPEGETYESRAKETQCFYFYTQKADRPVLTLSANWATDVTASVDITSKVTGKLLVQSLVGQVENGFLMEPFGGGKKDDGTTYKSHIKADAPSSVKTEYENKTEYTILNALYDSATSEPPNDNGDYPSIFDAYADVDTQNRLIQFMTLNNTGQVVRAVTDTDIEVRSPKTKDSDTLEFKESDLQKTVPYVCIAMAESTLTKTYGFRATQNLYVNDDDKPTITATGTLDYVTDEDGKNGKIVGQMEIVFDQTIYAQGTPTDRFPLKPVVQSPKMIAQGALADNKYYGFGNAVACNSTNGLSIPDAGKTDTGDINENLYTETQVILIDIERSTSRPANVTFTVSGLRNSSGTPMDACTITFEYDSESQSYNPIGKCSYSTRP